MSERETQNFMTVTVDSFSELPFLRQTPAGDRSSDSNSSIRIFGIDFPHEPDSSQEEPSKEPNTSTADTSTAHQGTANPITTRNNSGSRGESGRKFECHYCCRNFPTSQALGGHQNAHKRERQHAKRAHLQSTMAAHHHHQPGLITDGHLYGLLGYHRLGSAPSAGRFETPPPPHYPSWNGPSTSICPGTRFYGGLGTVSQPIDGSPLPGLWRLPVLGGAASFGMIHRDRSMALPLLGGDDSTMVAIGGAGGMGSSSSFSSSSSSTSPQNRGGYGSGAKETVSLDLHL
ncbi:zinc finger protein 8-like [Phoenix dactylifera]|uniref:Zinc finger protein 8-like n=1 Tax=Phoenix dactylifera TaxID=42345 RepID=A0A8B7C4Y6_PHODC|nr:zinc finger protein 8-like [Phoenix dactylifera]